jgi:peptidyl-prolyl cis-trans isomerase C
MQADTIVIGAKSDVSTSWAGVASRHMIAVALLAAAVVYAPGSSRGQALASDPLEAQVMALDPLLTPAASDPLIAKVDGAEIRQSDLALAEETLGRGIPARDENVKRENLINYLSDMILLSNAAKKQNLADEADMQRIQRRIEFTRNKALMEKLLKTTAQAAVTEEAVRKVYEEAVLKQGTETEIRLRSIVFLFKDVNDEAAVKAAEDKANAAIKRLANGEDFAAVAKDMSESPGGQQNGGDLGYMTRSMMGKEFAEVAFKLDNGSVSQPVKTQFGWFVLKVEDKRTRKPVDFEVVQDKLRIMVARRAQLQLISSLRSEAKIELLDKPDASEVPAEAAK